MAINFCYDQLGPNPDLGHPNLVNQDLEPDLWDVTWPYCIPLRLLVYLQRANIAFATYPVEQAPAGSWYPIAFSWHDHSIDYFDLLAAPVLAALKRRDIRVLFYYHEGDNPVVIQSLLDQAVQRHALPRDCYVFISANSRAQDLDRFRFFSDHDHFFQYLNRRQRVVPPPTHSRPYKFTVLSRTHKWWRAAVMSDLWAHGLLDQSQWSYNTQCRIDDDPADNPLRIHEHDTWAQTLQDFMQQGPYRCDSHDQTQHNDHRSVNLDLYVNSYCHLVLETHFDADGSEGSFITEKTYKCIKFGQPFVMIAPPGALRCLREQGYRVFDHVIDNHYDDIIDNTQRWFAIRHLVQDLAERDLDDFLRACMPDLLHNQSLFQSTQKQDLQDLAQYLDVI